MRRRLPAIGFAGAGRVNGELHKIKTDREPNLQSAPGHTVAARLNAMLRRSSEFL